VASFLATATFAFLKPDTFAILRPQSRKSLWPRLRVRSVCRTALPRSRAPPSTGWRVTSAEPCDPFAPAPLQSLPHCYGSLRLYAPHRYSGPHGLSHLDISLGIGTTGSHVPYESLMRARAVFTLDAARSEIRSSAELVPGDWQAPGFDAA
jgi:hypothetical protein